MQIDAILKPPSLLTRLIGPVLFLVLGAGTEWLLFEYGQQQAGRLKADNALQGEVIRARLKGELNTVAALGDSLAGYWAVRRNFANPTEIRDILAEFYRHGHPVSGLAVAADYRVAQAFPPDDSDFAVGSDYREQPRQWPFVQRCVESRSPVLEGPMSESQGLVYWMPVFMGGQFQGLVSVMIDGPALFSAAGLTGGEHGYALRVQKQPSVEAATVLGGDGLFSDPTAAVTEVEVPGGIWRLAVKSAAPPADEWLGIVRLLGWLLAGWIAAQSAILLGLKRQNNELALHDPLTGLPSRPLFLDRLKQTLRRTKRNRGNFSVLFVNLDEFKAINERLGEKVGDMMLAGIGKRLLGSIRHCDTVTRWGGDEFLVLLDACPLEEARPITESLRHKVELPVTYGECELRVGAAIGAAAYPQDGQSLVALLKAAQIAMREDKNRRKIMTDSLVPASARETVLPGGQASA
jgi:diguanylate cyclase (GGDEF)-like protein